MLSNDPKHAALVANGFQWVPTIGIWLNESRRKIVSSRAVQEWRLEQLLAFIVKPPANGEWTKGFSRNA